MSDMTDMFAGLHGEAFVEKMRALALIISIDGGTIRCGGCHKLAEFIGMQRCGAPGGPVCAGCLDLHRAYVDAWCVIEDVTPYCRFCDNDVDRTHVYAVNLWDGTEVAV